MIIQQPLITIICINRFHQLRTGSQTKSTAYILCNSSTNRTDIEDQLMDFVLHKASSTNSGYCIYMVKVGDIWFECDDVKITQIEINKFCNSDTVNMLFYKRCT